MHNDWLKFIPDIEHGYAPWLHDHGSLTRRIQHHCSSFHVQNIYNGLTIANHDEIEVLQLTRRQKIYTRDVFLFADNNPVVFAHSVVAAEHLKGAWHALQHLGNRPLGALLFTHPLIKREALRFQSLKQGHPLYQQATQKLLSPPSQLLARRSVFSLYSAPLLVTEVFLPHILHLQSGAYGA